MDLHHTHTVIEAQSAKGGVLLHRDVPTEPGYLIEAIKSVRGPKGVTLEEGPMADWAMRVIRPYVSEVLVCEPHHNHLIYRDEDKNDHVDPGKLLTLYRMNQLCAVHHPEQQSMMDFRRWVWLYHDQVELVTAAKNKIKAAFRMAGVQYGQGGGIYHPREREKWLKRLPARRSVIEHMTFLYANLDDLRSRRLVLYKRLRRIARRHPVAKRFLDIPGYREIRALTFLVVVDTPFRFPTVQKLWRYGGVGLREEQSGDPENSRKRPNRRYNHRLKDVAKGAAEIAVYISGDNPFKFVYDRLLKKGLKEPLARLTIARKMLSVPWGMWRGNSKYEPALVTKY